MRNYFKNFFMLAILYSCSAGYSQNYLPLEIGNRWDFKNYYRESDGSVQEKEPSTVIVKTDSVMPNGKTYFFLEGQGAYISGWIRADTNWLFRYNASDSTERQFINFNLGAGDTIYSNEADAFTVLGGKDTVNLFNQYTERIVFNTHLGFDNIMSVSFSNKFGYLGDSYYYFGSTEYSQLSGCIIGDSTYGVISGIDKPKDNSVKAYTLYRNYPNPFNPATTIKYSIPKTSYVTIKVYDLLGREAAILVNENKKPGNYSLNFNAGSLASGIYFYMLKAGNFVQTKKMILLK